jgi:predicted Abi (CAAX) family protease
LAPFGVPRHDWSINEYNLGSTMEDAPFASLMSGLGSWRCILPRLASDTVAGVLLKEGATLWVLGTDQIGGPRPEIAPVVPLTL